MEAKLQVSSEDWLKVHGLDANALTLDQLLPTVGFLQSKSEVGSLGHAVSSQYGDGVFVRQENLSGQVYNICGTSGGKLASIEEELKEAICLLKARYDWMITGSRLQFGVVSGRHAVMVIDYYGTEQARLSSLIEVAASVIKEQFIHLDQFNVISCTSGVSCWREGLVSVSDKSLEEVLAWLELTKPQTPPLTSNVLQALSKALEHTEADSVHLLSYGESSLRAFEQLLERVKPSLIPVNVSVLNCEREEKLEQYKSIAIASNGKCHCYTRPPSLVGNNPLLSSFSSLASSGSSKRSGRSGSGRSQTSRPSSANISSFPQSLTDADTLAIWKELDSARTTLAQIQALRIEMGGATCNCSPEPPKLSDTSITSEQWLEVYGLKAKKLMFDHLVQSLAFKHCNGIVQIPLPPKHKRTGKVEMVSHTKVVHAQYCKEFVHMRWPEGEVIHVQLSKYAHRVFCEGVEGVVGACRKRLSWLKKGSRELFGTLLETKIVIVVDTSVSMGKRLDLLKEKLQELIQEQLSTKDQFTVFHFNSKVYPWRENLVASSPQTLTAVSQWVDGLTAGGSTNTQAALVKAITVTGAEAVYLMTDGRPDTSTDVLLAKIQQLPRIPVHTISFNCGDSKANHFLAKLATNTGGRYHYLSEDVRDPEGPKTYQSEDITRLEEEINSGLDQLERANQLLAECQVTNKRCGKKKKRTAKIIQKTVESDTDSGDSAMDKSLMSSKKWLTKNSLSALKLTLMDALGPASIPHTTKHVPILQKDIHSKVFSQLFPLAHISNGNSMTLIHPSGVDLIGYENRLDEQTEVYWARLSCLAWAAIPTENRPSVLQECGLEEGLVPSYREHQAVLRRVLSQLKLPRLQFDFDLLEGEIRQAESYKQHSQLLREEVKKSHNDTRSVSSFGSHVPLMENPLYCISNNKGHCSKPSKSAKVIIRSKFDGYYYPGTVTNEQSHKSIRVELADKQEISTNSLLVIPVGGARPCPVLQRGDHALVRVRASINGHHPGPDGRCDYYIPGIVQVPPENARKGHALHSVLVFNGQVVTCDRRGIVKISEKRYADTCKYIREKMREELESTQSEETRSEASYTYSGMSSTRMPTPPESDQGSEISSTPSTARISVRSRASSIASSKKSATSNGPDLTALLESQRAQEELIQQYRRELLSMQEKQTQMEEQLVAQLSKGGEQFPEATQPAHSEQNVETHSKEQTECEKEPSADLDDFPDEDTSEKVAVITPPTKKTSTVSEKETSADLNLNGHSDLDDFPDEDTSEQVAVVIPPAQESIDNVPSAAIGDPHTAVLHAETGMNTDTMTEDIGVGTGPMTESVAVGTEWSHSETEISDEPAVSEESDTIDHVVESLVESPSEESFVQHTPISTPIPTPPISRANTPDHTQHSTPAPSGHNTPERSTSPTPSPDHVITPSYSHISTPEHKELETSPNQTSPIPSTPHMTALHTSIETAPLINQQVLVRWPDDGWYYRCTVVGVAGDGQWEVEDASGDTEAIPSCDIITDLVDSQRPLELEDAVASLHPDYSCSYAPGIIAGISNDGLSFTVELYDESQTTLRRHEVYRLAKSKHVSDVEYIRKKEAEWVGTACVVRNDSDGLFYPGKVGRQIPGSRRYIVQWADDSFQEQEVLHMYGPLTRKRPLRIGDHVIALADPKVGACMPGMIAGTKQAKLIVEFCDGQHDAVDPTHCFWVSLEYHRQAVEYICSHAPPPSNVGGADDDTVTIDTDDVLNGITSDYSLQ